MREKKASLGGGSITCTKVFEFDAAHRLIGHEGKCRSVHGHRYRLELTVAPLVGLDAVGRVLDFGTLSEVLGDWLNKHYDHRYIGYADDPVTQSLLALGLEVCMVPYEPTAENLVTSIALLADAMLRPHSVRVAHARLFETPTCWADWEAKP